MKKFNVKLFALTPHYFHDVEAEDEEAAIELASKSFETGYKGDFVDDEAIRVIDSDAEEVE